MTDGLVPVTLDFPRDGGQILLIGHINNDKLAFRDKHRRHYYTGPVCQALSSS
jgi:hypothetical protein